MQELQIIQVVHVQVDATYWQTRPMPYWSYGRYRAPGRPRYTKIFSGHGYKLEPGCLLNVPFGITIGNWGIYNQPPSCRCKGCRCKGSSHTIPLRRHQAKQFQALVGRLLFIAETQSSLDRLNTLSGRNSHPWTGPYIILKNKLFLTILQKLYCFDYDVVWLSYTLLYIFVWQRLVFMPRFTFAGYTKPSREIPGLKPLRGVVQPD